MKSASARALGGPVTGSGPAAVPPPASPPPTRSSLPLLLFWFVIPLIVLIVLEWFDVFASIPRWIGLESG